MRKIDLRRTGKKETRSPYRQMRKNLFMGLKWTVPFLIDRALSYRVHPQETVVVTGFWRSGTTWLQQSLASLIQAKTVFEPLQAYDVPDTEAVYSFYNLSCREERFLKLYMPYYPGGALDEAHPLYDFFLDALRAETRGDWVRLARGERLRQRITESFRPRVVLKLVRGQLCLNAVQDTFGMPAIHIYRDPRAVVASHRIRNWVTFFERPLLREQLLDLQDGRTEFFCKWESEIQEYDCLDWVARMTAYWALTEKFLLHSYACHQARIALVSYEDLAQKRDGLLFDILKNLNISHKTDGISGSLDTDSRSTAPARRGASTGERIAGWKKVLSDSEIRTIESITERFGLQDRLVDYTARHVETVP